MRASAQFIGPVLIILSRSPGRTSPAALNSSSLWLKIKLNYSILDSKSIVKHLFEFSLINIINRFEHIFLDVKFGFNPSLIRKKNM